MRIFRTRVRLRQVLSRVQIPSSGRETSTPRFGPRDITSWYLPLDLAQGAKNAQIHKKTPRESSGMRVPEGSSRLTNVKQTMKTKATLACCKVSSLPKHGLLSPDGSKISLILEIRFRAGIF